MNPAVYYLSSIESFPDYVPTEILIGGQIWDQKNLNTSRYRDGSDIPRSTTWNNATTGIWRYYNNDSTNGAIYGRLYNWYAMAGIYDAASLSNPALRKNIAPVGWRVATDVDWDQLASYVNTLTPTGNTGGKLKQAGTTLWASPNTNATNLSLFTALPGGSKAGVDGTFANLTLVGTWYTYDESTTTARSLSYNSGSLTINVPGSPNPAGGRSIRLIKEDIAIPGFTTTEASNIAVQSATSGATFLDLPSTPNLSDKGVCWGTTSLPNVVANSFISAGSGTTPNPYSVNITGLTPNVTYYIRAYATLADGSGVAYSTTVVSFTTPDGYPTVTTDAISNITGGTATGGGNVTSDGGFALSTFGIVWSTSTNPTIALSTKTVQTGTTGAFTSSITLLSPSTPYYVRAYATNSYGLTSYGSEVTFTTPAETVLLHAYSLRRVVPGATRAIRVRKGSSTTLFADIGFAAETDDLDQVALLNFIGANNTGYVQTWYDQTGSGKNAVSVTATREPIIVNSGTTVGTVVLKNGRPATTWGSAISNAGISQLNISSTSIKVNNTSLFMVCANTSTVIQRGIYYGGTDTAPATIFPRPTGGGSDVLYYNAGNRITMGTTNSTNKIYSMLSTATGVRGWKNNVEIGTGVNVTNTTTVTTVSIGISAAATERFTGTIQEMLFYVGDLAPTGTTSRSSITADAIYYYSI